MASYYSVIQYVQNPIADERVNIGIVAYDDEGKWEVRPLHGWVRAERFTGIPGRNLERHVEDVRNAIGAKNSPVEAVQWILDSWTHSVQLTAPRASLRPVEQTLQTAQTAVLIDTGATQVRRSGRPELARAAHGSMMQALNRAKLGPAIGQILEGRKKVPGAVEQHDVDLALRNGKLLMAMRVLAFPQRRNTYVEYEVSHTAWTVQDLRNSSESPRVTVLLGPPDDRDRPDFQRAERVLGELDADLVSPEQIEGWASRTVSDFRNELQAVLTT